ncbi:Cytochrome P450 83B1 [Linum grandiflorum]
MNIFVGGTDTSAATIVWAMTYAVVKETMRLQPSVPIMVPRESTESCNLGGYDIPAKTVVYINAWAIGRDTEAWGHNAEEFKPERFIGKSIDVRGLDFELIPFGAGRRGLSTVELSLANLLYAFDWEMPVGMKSEDLDMEVLPGITMHKKKDLCLVAKSYI